MVYQKRQGPGAVVHNKSKVSGLVQYHECVIHPGYLALSQEPAFLCSVCGNGVIVTIWDKLKKYGAIAHCIYHCSRGKNKPTNYYVDIALPQLVKKMLKDSGYAHNLEAQVFGGGNLRGHAARQARKVIDAARKILKSFKIEIVSEDIGGVIGRKVMFNTLTGEIVVLKTKKIRNSDWAPELATRLYPRNAD